MALGNLTESVVSLDQNGMRSHEKPDVDEEMPSEYLHAEKPEEHETLVIIRSGKDEAKRGRKTMEIWRKE
jgi:hypothetical protein